MVLIGAITWVRGVLLFIIQIVGGIVAAELVQALFQGDLAVSTTLGGGTTIAQGVLIEFILTAQLVFTIFMLAAEKHPGNFIALVGIGLSLFIAELVGQSTLVYQTLTVRRLEEHPRLTTSRRLLDWRVSQPCTLIRPCSGDPPLPFYSMDILGWALVRFTPSRPHLCIGQIARVRVRES